MILFNVVVESGRQTSSFATSAAEITLFYATVLHFSLLPILHSVSFLISITDPIYCLS